MGWAAGWQRVHGAGRPARWFTCGKAMLMTAGPQEWWRQRSADLGLREAACMTNSIDAVHETYRRAGEARELVRRQLCRRDGPWPKRDELLNMNGLAWALLRIQDAASDLDVVLGLAKRAGEHVCRATQEAHVATAAVPVTRHPDWWRVTATLHVCTLLAEQARTARGCSAVGCASAEVRC